MLQVSNRASVVPREKEKKSLKVVNIKCHIYTKKPQLMWSTSVVVLTRKIHYFAAAAAAAAI